MKNIYSRLIILFVVLALMSCEDISFLNTAPYSYTSPENYYKKLSDFENALVGCYETINTNIVADKTVETGTYSYGLQMMLNGGNDELIQSSNPTAYDFSAFGVATYNANNVSISNLWTAYIAGVMRCNYVISTLLK